MKKAAKFAALILAAIMAIAALAACSGRNEPANTPAPSDAPVDAPTDAPTSSPHDHPDENDLSKIPIGRVGTVDFTMADYYEIFQMYAAYAAYISDIDNLVKEQLVEMGVLFTKCEELGIELDEEDERALQQQLDNELEYALQQMEIDSGITGEDAIREARLEAFDRLLEEYGYTRDSYLEEVEADMRETMLIQKLQRTVEDELEFGDAQVVEYYNTALESDRETYSVDPLPYAGAFNAYIQNQQRIPLYTPEGVFTVKHLLIQFENTFNVPDEEGVFGDEENRKLSEVRSALEAGISLEDFINNFVSNAFYNDDTVFVADENEDDSEYSATSRAYREHGYVMHSQFVGNYFEGFGEAACVLYYGEDWLPVTYSDGSAPDESPVQKYGIKLYETTDGQKIAEVRTNSMGGGIHFIYIAEKLKSGEAKLDMGNENDPVYASILEFGRQALAAEHFEKTLEQWKETVNVELDDALIKHYTDEHFLAN